MRLAERALPRFAATQLTAGVLVVAGVGLEPTTSGL